MLNEKVNSRRSILLIMLILILALILLLAFCSRDQSEPVTGTDLTSSDEQLSPTTEQSEAETASNGSMVPTDAAGDPADCLSHRYLAPVRLGTNCVYSYHTSGTGTANVTLEITEPRTDPNYHSEAALGTLTWTESDGSIRQNDFGILCLSGADDLLPGVVIPSPGWNAYNLPYDVAPGMNWSFRSSEATDVYRTETRTIAVPAGNFEALCLLITWTDIDPDANYWTWDEEFTLATYCYAEGIGLVYEEIIFTDRDSGEEYVQWYELVDYYVPPE
jgi:hypothetical protein